MNWYLEVLKKYAVFSGRASRKEYWMFALFNGIIYLLLVFVTKFAGSAIGDDPLILTGPYSLAVLLPSFAVAVRRLHDIDRSGWWISLYLIPIIGFIVVFIFHVKDSTPGDNEYGVNPKDAAA